MLYIVSGFMRSGTSMMMRALEAGGLDAVYSTKRDSEMNARWGQPDYLPNDSYYELDGDDYLRGGLEQRYPGKLVKCLWGGVLRLPPGDYRVVFMRRPAAEIRVSLLAFFGSDYAATQFPDLDKAMDGVIDILRDRRSFRSVDVLHYKDVLANPRKAFASLNWPIDVKKAAAIPSRDKARFVTEANVYRERQAPTHA
jgi:hypothetical protein